MRTLLTVCTLLGAFLGAPDGRGALAAVADATQVDAGYLHVESDPPARIAIDDADTRAVTPQAHLELKAGHHKLTLVTLDGTRKRSIGFNVEAGQTTTLTIHLSP
jgi:hypothetical protein